MSKHSPVKTTLLSLSAEMEALATKGLEAAKKKGADAAKISSSCTFDKRLVVENKQFSLANSLETQKFGIVVHKDGKKGSAQINTREEEGLVTAISDALAIAAFSVPDEGLTMATRDMAPPAKPLPFQFDDALAEIELGELQEIMQSALARAIKDKRVALDKFEMSATVSWHSLMNSHGVKQSEAQTMISWNLFGMAVDGSEVSGFDYDMGATYTKSQALPRAIASAELFAERVIGNLKPVKCPSYRGPVIFSPRAVEELIVGMILYHASGSSVMDGKSKWADAVGSDVLSKLFTLRDNPHSEELSGSTSFDGDGIPTRAQTIIDAGRLTMHLHDCYTAKKTKSKTTVMSGGPFALSIQPGDKTLAELAAARTDLLLVDRFSGNTDPVKGDFSGVAKNSRLFRGGNDIGAVSETMIAGNFFEMAKNLLAATRATEMVSASFVSPYLLIDGVSVTGG